jgi:hypothetical protein
MDKRCLKVSLGESPFAREYVQADRPEFRSSCDFPCKLFQVGNVLEYLIRYDDVEVTIWIRIRRAVKYRQPVGSKIGAAIGDVIGAHIDPISIEPLLDEPSDGSASAAANVEHSKRRALTLRWNACEPPGYRRPWRFRFR